MRKMTKQEAIHILMHISDYVEHDEDFGMMVRSPLMDASLMAIKALKVDSVEVVHGRWITDQVEAFSPLTEEPYPLDVLQCSVCGEYFDVSEARNYCPNCGAKMDGGTDNG